jgi:uncharacterized protein YbjT (DUF2867 family)
VQTVDDLPETQQIGTPRVKILVIGASQGIGLEVSKAAAKSGHHVRAMARRVKEIGDIDKRIEPFAGDALKPDDVHRALEGIEVVVQALGVPPSLGLILRPVTLFSSATRILLPAMKSAGVGKLVCVTGFGAGDSEAAISFLQRLPFKALLQNAYTDKSRQEELIVASELDWLIVRPGVLINSPATGRYKILTTPNTWRNGIVARADVADFIVSRINAGKNPSSFDTHFETRRSCQIWCTWRRRQNEASERCRYPRGALRWKCAPKGCSDPRQFPLYALELPHVHPCSVHPRDRLCTGAAIVPVLNTRVANLQNTTTSDVCTATISHLSGNGGNAASDPSPSSFFRGGPP